MGFIGRKEDLRYLEGRRSGESHPLVILTGRRRVGKSTLLKKFAEGKNAVCYEVNATTKELAPSYFSRNVGKALGRRAGDFRTWDDAVAAFVESNEGRKAIIIDEFQYLAQSDESIPTIFQSIWDNYLSSEDVMPILCGSHMTMMRGPQRTTGAPFTVGARGSTSSSR